MGRYQFPAFVRANTPRYLVVWSLHWEVIERDRLEPGSDLQAAMAAIIGQLRGVGWQIEGEPDYGFVFVNRAGERRLLMLTPRDPYSTTLQSFSPFVPQVRS